jgi:raffinose/stachyose/melibiose transport system permease protein
MTKGSIINSLFRGVIIIIAVIFAAPFYFCITMAFKTPSESAASALALPKTLSFDNFQKSIQISNFNTSIINSLIVTSVSVVLIVLLSSMCGYVISRNMDKRRYKILDKLILFGIMVPFQVIMIPVFKTAKTFNLLNTRAGIIILIVGTSLPYAIFLITGFVKTVPRELEEAARMDGAGIIKIFGYVVFPLLKPITATVAILHSLWIWNEFNISLIILQKERVRTIPIQQFHFFGEYSINLNFAFASACVSMVPIVIFFLIAQKQLIQGITQGAVKA